MSADVIMPRLSDSMTEGTIIAWIKQPGDEVAVGEELVEIETDKATMVYESDVAGTLIEVVAGENETVAVGEVIARVADPDESTAGNGADPVAEREATPQASSAATAESVGVSSQALSPRSAARVKASPVARRMAGAAGLDLATIEGSGPGGRVVKADVEQALASGSASTAESPRSAPMPAAPNPGQAETAHGAVERVELDRLQQSVARRMAESKATVPHFYLQAEVDMSRAFAARNHLKDAAREGELVPSFNDMAVKACALALREFPRAKGAYRDGRWELYERINVGIAVAAPGSLVVPTIFDADRKGLREIAAEALALAERVRDRSVTPPELAGGTFTVSNLGMYGVSSFHPVINPPQAAILAVGEIADVPAIRDGELASAKRMGMTLACDHRILYGAEAAEFLRRVKVLLEEPAALAL